MKEGLKIDTNTVAFAYGIPDFRGISECNQISHKDIKHCMARISEHASTRPDASPRCCKEDWNGLAAAGVVMLPCKHPMIALRVPLDPLVSSNDLFQMILISPLIAMTSKLSYPVAPVLLKAQHRQQKAAQLLQNHFRGWRARRLGSTWSWFCVAGNS